MEDWLATLQGARLDALENESVPEKFRRENGRRVYKQDGFSVKDMV